MVLRIRLSRFGSRHQPFYNIVLTQARTARDSKPLEVLGTYNPVPQTPLASNAHPDSVLDPVTGARTPYAPKRYKDIQLDASRTKYWLGVGAQPSGAVEKLLTMIGLMAPRPGKTSPTAASTS